MISFAQIDDYVFKGYLHKVKHPIWDLFIYNYSHKTSEEALWDDLTLICRGLILDKSKTVVAYPMKKFFEIEQLNKGILPKGLPYTISEKIDGSLGILYWQNRKPFIATRGRFDSFQALLATNILYKKYKDFFKQLNQNLNYYFEIVSSHNRNIIDYGIREELYLLGASETKTGLDVPVDEIAYPFPRPKVYDMKIADIENFLAENSQTEGLVVRYSNGFRVKYKSKEFNENFKRFEKIKTLIINSFLSNGSEVDFESLLSNQSEAQFAKWAQNQIEKVFEYSLHMLSETKEDLSFLLKKYPQLYRSILQFEGQTKKEMNDVNILKAHVSHQIEYGQYFSKENSYDLSIFDSAINQLAP